MKLKQNNRLAAFLAAIWEHTADHAPATIDGMTDFIARAETNQRRDNERACETEETPAMERRWKARKETILSYLAPVMAIPGVSLVINGDPRGHAFVLKWSGEGESPKPLQHLARDWGGFYILADEGETR